MKAAAACTGRWALNRAGIINVYQHGNETLQFGGGRLLLGWRPDIWNCSALLP